ncbi:MAG: sugar phosphate isomerase/epimerase [Gemmataceae bacterium]|nr:sugar phosphate isomerase/epimerase [Gemmataceae bacterium]MDW8266066.1 sugar phosphate isomerase/epimerase family protein [Gemmataceae bacterium]
MTLPCRRQFLRSAAAATAAGLSLKPTVSAIEPIRRLGRPHFRLSVAAYGFRKYLDLKAKPKPSMTLEDFIDFVAQHDADAVELTAYYFPQTTPEYLAQLKGRAARLGLDISGTAVGNNFCLTDPVKHRAQIDMVKAWTEHSARLGAKTMRIFAGTAPKGGEEAARKQCLAAIEEACDHAAKFGVILALENHGGITSTAEQLLTLVRAINHSWFGVNLDTGNFITADPYADLAQLAPYAVNVQLKTEIQRSGRAREEADLPRLLDILRQVNYRGYVALEYEAAEDPKTAVPRHLATLRKLMRS